MEQQPCLFCGGDASESDHRCAGPRVESSAWKLAWAAQPGRQPLAPLPPSSGLTPETRATSREAAAAIEPDAATLRAAVLAHIRACGTNGATDDEIQLALALDGNTERPRRWELSKADLIVPAGQRLNVRGRRCAVWVAA